MTVSHSICYEASLDNACNVGHVQLSYLDVPTVYLNFERFVARMEAMLLCIFFVYFIIATFGRLLLVTCHICIFCGK